MSYVSLEPRKVIEACDVGLLWITTWRKDERAKALTKLMARRWFPLTRERAERFPLAFAMMPPTPMSGRKRT